MEEKILKELIKSRNILKNKFQSIKLGETEKEAEIEKQFKPLTEPLKKLVKLSDESSIKPIIKKYKGVKFKSNLTSNINKEEDEEMFESAKEEEEEDDEEDNDDYSKIDEGFNLAMLKNNPKFDSAYGPHQNENGEWKFGNAYLKFNGNKIYIGNQKWNFTPGLFELICLKNPKNYEPYELQIYKKILINTSAHKLNNDPKNEINISRKLKYTKIIKDLFASTHTGEGLLKANCKKSKYIYYQNPNTLVERLQLLVMAKHSGHSNVQIEINTILEELRKLDIIY